MIGGALRSRHKQSDGGGARMWILDAEGDGLKGNILSYKHAN